MDVKSFFARLSKADFADAVGVALGAEAAALALVRKRFNTVAVVLCESVPLDGDATQRWQTVAEVVRSFVARHAPEGARIAVALERRAALLAHMQLPAAAAENLEKVVAYEADAEGSRRGLSGDVVVGRSQTARDDDRLVEAAQPPQGIG